MVRRMRSLNKVHIECHIIRQVQHKQIPKCSGGCFNVKKGGCKAGGGKSIPGKRCAFPRQSGLERSSTRSKKNVFKISLKVYLARNHIFI